MFCNEELSSKNGVGWFGGLRVADVVPKVATGKEIGGCSEAGRRDASVSVPSKNLKQKTGDRPG